MRLKILTLALALVLFIPQAFAINGTEKKINVTVNGTEIVFPGYMVRTGKTPE